MNYKLAQKKMAELAEAEKTARRAKARADKLRRDLRRFFAGDAVEVEVKLPKRAKHSAPKAKAKPAVAASHAAKHVIVRVPSPLASGSTIAREPAGTRLNEVLKVLHALGGKGSVPAITARIPKDENRPDAAHRKLVRGCLSYLRTKGRVLSVKRGQWQITAEGQSAIGVNPQTTFAQPPMFQKQEGHA